MHPRLRCLERMGTEHLERGNTRNGKLIAVPTRVMQTSNYLVSVKGMINNSERVNCNSESPRLSRTFKEKMSRRRRCSRIERFKLRARTRLLTRNATGSPYQTSFRCPSGALRVSLSARNLRNIKARTRIARFTARYFRTDRTRPPS